jgi:hypothetical protein
VAELTFTDEILGLLTWNGEYDWEFEIGLPDGRLIHVWSPPNSEMERPSGEWLDWLRACVSWVRANEPDLRQRVADQMFNWWVDRFGHDDAVDNPEAFADRLYVTMINFPQDDPANIFYGSEPLLGSGLIWAKIDSDGSLCREPEFD